MSGYQLVSKLTHSLVVKTIDMHTGGEAVRIVVYGYPDIPGDTIMDKRRFVKEKCDHIRRTVMAEPRGHGDMYGVIPVKPDIPGADLAVLFMHNEGYSVMCGHATLSLGRFAVDYGLVPAVAPETVVRLQCPCGLVTVHVEYSEGRSGRTRFESVPCFVFAPDLKIDLAGYGAVQYDIVCGGTYYAYVEAAQLGLQLATTPISEIVTAAMAMKAAVAAAVPLSHPQCDELAFLYGVLLYTGPLTSERDRMEQLVVFADGQVDRCPCGSGSCGSLALLYHKGLISKGVPRKFDNAKTGTCFTGKVLREVDLKGTPSVVAEIAGNGYYTGESTFHCEQEDPLEPFLIQ